MNRLVAAWAAGLAVAAAAGCGVSAQETPHEIQPPGGPYPAFGATAPAAPEAGTAEEPLCFVRDDQLVRVVRRVRAWPTVETQMRDLVAGPNDAERDKGLTSALTGTTVIAGIRLSQGLVTVELGGDLDGVARSDEVLAYGQVVCTLSTRPDFAGALFMHDGQPLGVPRADGSLSQEPLTAADYADLIAS